MLPFETESFSLAWNSWLLHLSEKPKSKRPTATAIKAQLAKLAAVGERAAISMLKHSIEKNYQGLYQDPSYQPDEGRAIFAEVMGYATANGISESEASAFYDESETCAWRDWRGNPLQDWRSAFRAFVERRDKKSSGKPHQTK